MTKEEDVDRHERNRAKHEYEIQRGSSHLAPMIYAATTERSAIASALTYFEAHSDEDHVRLYHTYPSPGPQRRYVGVIKPDGVLYRAG
jgi:hypothetical protein